MASIIKSLHDLISQIVTCENRLEPYKMTEKQIKQVFAWLDQRRRGSVDVSDFYAKFSQLNQAQLFYVFKYLDVSRKGAFTDRDLITSLLVQSSSNIDRQDDSVKVFSNLVKILKATYYMIQQQKKKSPLTKPAIQKIFIMASLKNKDNIDITDLIVLFKESALEVNEKLLIFIKKNIFYQPNLNLNQFTQIISQLAYPVTPTQTNQTTTKNFTEKKYQYQEPQNCWQQCRSGDSKVKNMEKLTSEMDKLLEKYKTVPEVQIFPERRQEYQYLSQTKNYDYTEPRKYIPHQIYAKHQNQTVFNKAKEEFYQKKYAQIECKKMDALFNFPSSSAQGLNEINKRREQLRKGSLQRQKIIEEVISKKRNEFSNSGKPGMLYTNNLRIQSRQDSDPIFTCPIQIQRPMTPGNKFFGESNLNFDAVPAQKLRQNFNIQKQLMLRPSSASKTTSSFFDRNLNRPDVGQFYRKGNESSKIYTSDKENILKKAEEEATRKIEEIERRARLKVMQKRSIAGVYNRWLK